MADATFDGVNLVITLPINQTRVDVDSDLYTAWKTFQLAKKENMRFPAAFRTIGGDELTPGIDAGAYYFLQNNLGWRIRPGEQSQNVLLVGNLAPEDSSLDTMIPTIGRFTNFVNGLQPITQSVEALLLEQQNANFHGAVWIDFGSGIAGTEFPAGLPTSPSNNLIDAFSIATRLSVRKFVIVSSNVVMDRNAIDWVFQGRGVSSFDANSFNLTNAELINLDPIGNWLNTANVAFVGCFLAGVTNFQGTMTACGLAASNTLAAGTSTFVACFSRIIGTGTPVIDCQNLLTNVAFRGYNGGLEITNFNQASANLSIDADAIRLILGPTVVNGDIVIRGIGEFEDTTTGSPTINVEGFVDAKEIEILHQMQAGNADISLNDESITVFKRGSTTIPLATFSISPDSRIRRRLT